MQFLGDIFLNLFNFGLRHFDVGGRPQLRPYRLIHILLEDIRRLLLQQFLPPIFYHLLGGK